MSKDMMPHFDLYQPDSLETALDLAERLGSDGWLLAAGQDSFDWLKNRTKRTPAVIELTGIASLKGVRETATGLEIGALTTLTEIENDPLVKERYGLLSKAAGRVASPQIRNAGTIGGNLSQDTRCWYYRYGVDCYRAGGNMCYADTPDGQNREHAIFGASRCIAVTPSDTANAMVALDASMVIHSSKGERVVPAHKFFVGPAVDIRRMTVVQPGEILTAIRLPKTWAGATFYFEKVADRAAWDFALLSVAAAFIMEGDRIADARLVCGAVECVPRRLVAVEDAIRGSVRNDETATRAGKLAIEGAEPRGFNQFKVPLMENLVRRAIRDA
ncbi:MAG TPA: xanthine dehydrogenase family protein subunit M [Steroidobacteraceae bacterium]|jgi:xanthine dehydrogenase YagS FAD-binding subunit|nr:xanthine dehydrogenase family protein subunit M [Steroidobacteraceae bacterium]